MSTANAAIPAFEPDLQSQLQAAVDRLVKGTRDPEAIRPGSRFAWTACARKWDGGPAMSNSPLI